jgi:hypothetical protein
MGATLFEDSVRGEKTVVRQGPPSARMALRGRFRKSSRALAWIPGLQEGEGLEQEEGPAECALFVAEALVGDGPADHEGLVQQEKEPARVLQTFEGQIQGSGEPGSGLKSSQEHRSRRFEDEACESRLAGHPPPSAGAVPHADSTRRAAPSGPPHAGSLHASPEGGAPSPDTGLHTSADGPA